MVSGSVSFVISYILVLRYCVDWKWSVNKCMYHRQSDIRHTQICYLEAKASLGNRLSRLDSQFSLEFEAPFIFTVCFMFFHETTLDKMVCHFWHESLTPVFIALSYGTTIHFAPHGSPLNHNLTGWNNSNSQSESFVLVAFKAAMERKKKGTIWKSYDNWVRNWCQKWHTILFTATNQDNKQWDDSNDAP